MNEVMLPNGWCMATLGEVADETVDRCGPAGSEFIYVDISSIDREQKFISDAKVIESASAPSRAKQVLQEGDVLISMTRPNLNAIALVTPEFHRAIGSTGFHVLRSKWVESKFLFYLVHTREFIEKMCLCVQGALYPAVRPNDIASFLFSLPSRPEQHRIVAKIEELFSELDKGIENLKTAQAQLKVYRQALLKHAFEGKLTAQWRRENQDKLETADALQKRIQQERAQRYQQQLADWEAAVKVWGANGSVGKKPAKPRKTVELDKPSTEHSSRIWDVPNGWQWLQIGEFAFVTKLAGFEYTKYVRYSDDGDLPVIKAENAGLNGFRVTQYSHVYSDSVAELTRSHLWGGELLMVFVGAGTGNVATVPSDKRFFLGPNVGMMRVESDEVDPRYVEHFLRSPLGKDLALASVKAVAQPSLSMGTIRQIPVALPTRAEQDEIVEQIEAKLSEVDQLELTITTSLQQAEALRQSILKKAFSGQLVPQDPHDESASALLVRIRTERDKASNPKSKGKKV